MINPQCQAQALALIQASKQHWLSGHDLRNALRAQGFDKKEIGFSLAALVEQGQLERVKITDEEGMFYTAYRLITA